MTAEEFAKIKENFIGYYSDENDTKKTIKETYEKNGYLIDTHTAVGYNAAKQYISENGNARKIILASTASPFKFACDVYEALNDNKAEDELLALELLSKQSDCDIPTPIRNIGERKVRFSAVCDAADMKKTVIEFAKNA